MAGLVVFSVVLWPFWFYWLSASGGPGWPLGPWLLCLIILCVGQVALWPMHDFSVRFGSHGLPVGWLIWVVVGSFGLDGSWSSALWPGLSFLPALCLVPVPLILYLSKFVMLLLVISCFPSMSQGRISCASDFWLIWVPFYSKSPWRLYPIASSVLHMLVSLSDFLF